MKLIFLLAMFALAGCATAPPSAPVPIVDRPPTAPNVRHGSQPKTLHEADLRHYWHGKKAGNVKQWNQAYKALKASGWCMPDQTYWTKC
jgi:hypothetical protein